MAEEWPGIMFVKTLQMQSYAYPWFIMPEGESKDTLKADYMKLEILTGRSALTDGYCTWLDGHVYEGEESPAQFGVNPNIVNEWFGASFIKAKPVKYDFLSEGDSPTYFCLLDWASKDKYEDAEHMPALEIKEGLDFTAAPCEKVVLHASATTTDKTSAGVSFKIY